jgi:hypothetical protein
MAMNNLVMPLMGLPMENAGDGSSTKYQKQMTVQS